MKQSKHYAFKIRKTINLSLKSHFNLYRNIKGLLIFTVTTLPEHNIKDQFKIKYVKKEPKERFH